MKLLILLAVVLLISEASAFSRQKSWRERKHQKPTMTMSETADMLCNVLVQASNLLLNEQSADIDSIKKHLRNDCMQLPNENNLVRQCETAVDRHLPDILRHLQSGIKSDEVCSLIQKAETSKAAKPKPRNLTSNGTCVLCELLVKIADSLMTTNKSEQEILKGLEKFCTLLPNDTRAECKTFVDQNAADIIALLAREADPDKVCTLIKACSKSFDVTFMTKPNTPACSLCKYVDTYMKAGLPIEHVCSRFTNENNRRDQCEILVHFYQPNMCPSLTICEEEIVEIETPKVNPVECAICQFVVGYVDKYIQNNKSQAAVDAALEKVCALLPHAMNATCVSFVDQYAPILLQYIIAHGTPDAVCQALKLCANKTENIVPQISAIDPECVLCEFIITYVEKTVGNNHSIAAVDAALEKVCNILPASLQPNCTHFVKVFGIPIALLIAKNESAQQICTSLKACNGTNMPVQPKANPLECAICQFVVGYVDKYIGNNKSQAAVDAALEKVCGLLPHSMNASCVKFVDQYASVLLQYIIAHGTPDAVCQALKLCSSKTETVVSQKPKANPVECSICQFVVAYVDKFIGTNKSQAAVDAALEKVCGLLPHAMNATCVSFVDQYAPVLLQYIIAHGSPDAVCQALKLCSNKTETVVPQKPTVSPQCSLCEFVIQYLEKAIGSNRSTAAVEAYLDKACLLLPGPTQTVCMNFVNKSGPIIAQLISQNQTVAQICDTLKMCNNGTEKRAEMKTVGSGQCALCKYVVAYVDAVIQTNQSEAAIDAALEKVCTIVPHAINASCIQFVDTFGPKLAEYIAKYETPDNVCNAIGLCKNGSEIVAEVETVKVEKEAVAGPVCALCEFVVGYVLKVVENNKSEAAIEHALEKACLILPESKRNECVAFVDKYGTELIELIEKFGTPKAVCAALGVCLFNTQPAIPAVGSTQCILCKYIIAYVDAVVQTNKSEAAINAALEQVCKILPHSLNASCIQFVDTFGPEIVEYIVKYGTPDKVCDAIGVCKNGSATVESKSIKPVGSDSECSLCKYVISYVDLLLESNKSQEEIVKALDGICKVLPQKDHAKCEAFVSTYGPVLPQLIAELDDPNVVCDWLSMCNKNKTTSFPSVKLDAHHNFTCTLCEYLVNYLDAIVQSNSTEVKFEEELEKACKILPTSKVQGECKTLVDLYSVDIIKFVVELGQPDKVCKEIGICEK